VLLLSLRVSFRHRATQQRHFPAPIIISIVGAERHMVLFVIVRAISFRKPQHGTRRPDRQRARGSKSLRRPRRTYFIGVAKPRESSMWQHLLGGEATRGVGMEKGTDELPDRDVGRKSQISTSPQAAIDPRRAFVGHIPTIYRGSSPLCRLPYHLLHAIFPEWHVS